MNILLADCPRLDLTRNPPRRGTPLLYVTSRGNIDLTRKLIARKAPINQPNSDGYTPLMYAFWGGPRPEIITVLLNAGATVDATNNEGRTALRRSLLPAHTSTQAADLLLAHGASPTLADKQGVTPITAAHLLGYGELAARMEALSKSPPASLPCQLPILAPPADPVSPEAMINAFTRSPSP